MTHSAATAPLDHEAAYRACSGRDARWDGRLYLGVTSTGIYCRPSCPARTPRREHCRFFATAAACVAAGFRACKRCRPDALPGTRDWNAAGDLAARALRAVRDGAMDGDGGLDALAQHFGVSARHLRRVVVEATGATPIQLATTRRAAAARQLIEQTELPLADVAFAAGFGSVRRFNEAMRAEFGAAPSTLARRGGGAVERGESFERPTISLQLRFRRPYAVAPLRAFLTNHAVPGLERASDDERGHERVVPVPGGLALARLRWPDDSAAGADGDADAHARDDAVHVWLTLPRLDDLMPAIEAVRRWLDLDADPGLIDEALAADPRLAPLVRVRPGIRIPGATTPAETALAIVLGQQVSVAAARTVQGRLAAAYGEPAPGLDSPPEGAAAWRCPPDPAAIANDGVARVRERLGIDGNRATALVSLATALADGLDLSPAADRGATRARLLALPRIGPWTADLIALRCLGDPDVFAAGDLVARRTLARHLGVERLTPAAATATAEAWRPWRSSALMHLWAAASNRPPASDGGAPPHGARASATPTNPEQRTDDTP